MPSAAPIVLQYFRPLPALFKVLSLVESLGFENALLCGGALRDSYLGLDDRINDYDLVANFGATKKILQNAGDYRQAMIDFIDKRLNGIDMLSRAPFDGLPDDLPDHQAMTLKFRHQGREFSLSLATDYGVPEDWVEGDAPINSIVMDSKGRILAHPQFEEHAKGRIYAAFNDIPPERAAARLEYLQKKIEGLKTP